MGKVCLRLLKATVVSYLLLVISASLCFAEDSQFNISYDTTYSLDTKGTSAVTQVITIQNKETQSFASSYTLTVIGKKAKNISAFQIIETNNKQKKEDLSFSVNDLKSGQEIIISFPNPIVGKDKSRTFTVSYIVDNTAQKNGEVWDVTIPKLANPEQVLDYKLTVSVPSSFGNPAYISPQPKNRTSSTSTQIFTFEKDDLIKAGVIASFGEFQIYNFSINYHIENPNSQKGEVTIALPPDTNYQRVYYENIDPKPTKLYLDDDGNWIGSYFLYPQEQRNVLVQLKAQVFAKPQEYYFHNKGVDYPFYLQGNDVWPTGNSEILKLARENKTPKSIYETVINTLSYDYSRVGENAKRLGAGEALIQPDKALCMEYTDLFVSIARAAGIPAREVNGYAYTENSKLQPLSLVADVLHSWPEYWDSERNIWQPVDPTWEDTTGGVDYFNKFDLSHVTFAIHGKDPKLPYPAGSYKTDNNTKDVQVEFGNLPQDKEPKTVIKIGNFPFLELPFRPIERTFHLENIGKVALYNVPITVSSEGVQLFSESKKEILFLGPYSQADISVSIKPSLIPSFKPMRINIIAGEESLEYDIPAGQVYGVQAIAIFTILLGLAIFSFSSVHIMPKAVAKVRKKYGHSRKH